MACPVPVIEDPGVPAVALLLGPGHQSLLRELVGPAGGTIRSSRIGQVRYVPGRSITAQYEVDVQAAGATTRETYVAMSGIRVPDGTPVFEGDGVTVAVWRYPNDPFLPGLAAAADSNSAAALLGELGAPTRQARLRRRAYRAGRRAVIQVTGATADIYLKVTRPARVEALQRIHRVMATQLPVPHSLGWSRDLGVIALEAIPGRPLRKAIESGSTRLPPAGSLVALLDRIPAVDELVTAGTAARVEDHARLIAATMPSLRPRLDAFAGELAQIPEEQPVPVHGDFHSSQVLVDGPRISGLVDVDTAGLGARSDDLAGMLAHLSTLALTSPQRGVLERYGASLTGDFDRLVDPRGLRLRVAAAVLGFATGPFRVQMTRWREETAARLELAERWVASAGAASDWVRLPDA